MDSSVSIDNKKKYILILGTGHSQGLGDTTLAAEKMNSITFTENNQKVCLRWHYNGTTSYLFVNCTEIIKLKAKYSEIVATPLYLGHISKDLSVDNWKRLDFLYKFMTLVLIMMLLELMIY